MKILHLSTARTWRGGEQQLAYLMRELRGEEQLLLCVEGSALADYCRENALPHLALPKKSSTDLSFARKLAQVTREEKPDILHVHDSHSHTFAVMATVFFGMKLPVVVHRRVAFKSGGSLLSRYKYRHPTVKAVICVSEAVRQVVQPVLRNPSLAQVIHDGIDLSRFSLPDPQYLRRQLQLPEGKILIGTVAAFTAEKDYPTFIKTAEKLLSARQDLHFVLIGSGEQLEEIQSMIAEKKLMAHFSLTGFRDDVDQLLPGLDIFLFTSQQEGFGSSLLDAFAAGVPVVATRVGGIPEIVTHEVSGYIAAAGDWQSLAEAVLQLLEQEKLREKFRQEALLKVKTFDTKNMARQTLALYNKVT